LPQAGIHLFPDRGLESFHQREEAVPVKDVLIFVGSL
jgi:hypothetical protein